MYHAHRFQLLLYTCRLPNRIKHQEEESRGRCIRYLLYTKMFFYLSLYIWHIRIISEDGPYIKEMTSFTSQTTAFEPTFPTNRSEPLDIRKRMPFSPADTGTQSHEMGKIRPAGMQGRLLEYPSGDAHDSTSVIPGYGSKRLR